MIQRFSKRGRVAAVAVGVVVAFGVVTATSVSTASAHGKAGKSEVAERTVSKSDDRMAKLAGRFEDRDKSEMADRFRARSSVNVDVSNGGVSADIESRSGKKVKAMVGGGDDNDGVLVNVDNGGGNKVKAMVGKGKDADGASVKVGGEKSVVVKTGDWKKEKGKDDKPKTEEPKTEVKVVEAPKVIPAPAAPVEVKTELAKTGASSSTNSMLFAGGLLLAGGLALTRMGRAWRVEGLHTK